MNSEVHRHTPGLTVIDGRGLPVRTVAYYCSLPGVTPESRITRKVYDTRGHLVSLSDPRLGQLYEQHALTSNRRHTFSLSGIPLLSESVDAGWHLGLCAEAGNVIASWDERGSSWQTGFDAFLRPIATLETSADGVSRTIERRVYSDNSSDAIEHNQCANIIRIDDTAGSLLFPDYGLFGQPLTETRHFLKTIEIPDWSGINDFHDLVEPHGMTTHWSYSPSGDCLHEIDASHNRKRYSYTVAGELAGVYLQVAGASEQRLLARITYNAQGQVLEQTAGNGVTSQRHYDAADARLESLTDSKQGRTLQALHYRYDAVGNIVQMADRAQATRYFANQRIEPITHYAYDSLYQLTQASGREAANACNSPQLPDVNFNPPDTSQLLNYTEEYQYDAGGNLLQLRHQREGNNYTRAYAVAAHSNRTLAIPDNGDQPDFNNSFDGNGNLQLLQPGQRAMWDARNQLCRVTLLGRKDGNDDEEHYLYDGSGHRARKVRTALAKGRVIIDEVRYLPGLEIRRTQAGLADEEQLEVSHVQAADFTIRCLHWVHGKPDEIDNDQVRYGLDDLLGCITLELDADGDLLSHEGYYPYGGTAWWAARSAVQAKYKTLRYSGKELDASGLYYYGLRYYASWLQRWINPDPAGDIDGLNLYWMAGNNPISYRDTDGSIKDFLASRNERPEYKERKDKEAEQRSKMEASIRLAHKIIVHSEVLYLVKQRAAAAQQQLRNALSTKNLANSTAIRIGVVTARGATSAAATIGGTLVGGILGGAVTAGAGALPGALVGGAMARAAASQSVNTLADILNLNATIHLRPNDLAPDVIFKKADIAAGSLIGVIADDLRETIKALSVHAVAETVASIALSQTPQAGPFLAEVPYAARVGLEVLKSREIISPETFIQMAANIEALQAGLETRLAEFPELFKAAGKSEISYLPFSTHTVKSLESDTKKVIDLLHTTWGLVSEISQGDPRKIANGLRVSRL